jgi:hypothetical protein
MTLDITRIPWPPIAAQTLLQKLPHSIPSSGRSTRQWWNVKRSRRPPGATRRVSSQLLTSTYHPEHGEAGRGQRLISHTRQEHPVGFSPFRREWRECLPAGLSSVVGGWLAGRVPAFAGIRVMSSERRRLQRLQTSWVLLAADCGRCRPQSSGVHTDQRICRRMLTARDAAHRWRRPPG